MSMTNPNHPARKRFLELQLAADRIIGYFSASNIHATKAEKAICEIFDPVRRAVEWEEEHNADGSMLTSSQVAEANYILRKELDPSFKRKEDELEAKVEEYLRKKKQEEESSDD